MFSPTTTTGCKCGKEVLSIIDVGYDTNGNTVFYYSLQCILRYTVFDNCCDSVVFLSVVTLLHFATVPVRRLLARNDVLYDSLCISILFVLPS